MVSHIETVKGNAFDKRDTGDVMITSVVDILAVADTEGMIYGNVKSMNICSN